MHAITLRLHQALGDAVALTAVVRDLKRQHPQYRLALDVNWKPVWEGNPYATVGADAHARRVEVGYTAGVAASKAGRPVHLIRALCDDLFARTGVRVEPEEPRGELAARDGEDTSPVAGRYWVVFAGGKLDMTVKHWHAARYQAVVDRLLGLGVRCVQGGAAAVGHVHPPLKNVLGAVGRTENVRDLIRLIRHADGVVCGVSGPMHVAAALARPCVVLAGGREEPSFFGYTNAYLKEAFGPRCRPVGVEHKILHTVGLLHCCGKAGCWRKRTVVIDAKDVGRPDRVCLEPVRGGDHPVPKCLDLVTADHAVEAVMSYYEDGMLPPIGKPTGKYALPQAEVGLQPVLANPQTMADIMAAWGPPPALAFVAPPLLPERPQQPASLVLPAEPAPLVPGAGPPSAMDHPHVGGRFTCFVLCYGDHFDLAKRCLDSILNTTPPGRLDLRVAANACSDRTLGYLRGLPLTRLYVYAENRKKYPVMRDVFRDPACPIQSEYLLWFDDDSYVTHPQWLERLAETIASNHQHGARHYGWLHIHDVKMFAKNGHDPRRWFQQAPWWRGKNLRVRGTKTEAPNGTVIEFIPGSFWALHTGAMLEADIPCSRLCHNGGDITMGEQVHQAGYKTVGFNKDRQFVYTSGSPRRGYSESFGWANRPG